MGSLKFVGFAGSLVQSSRNAHQIGSRVLLQCSCFMNDSRYTQCDMLHTKILKLGSPGEANRSRSITNASLIPTYSNKICKSAQSRQFKSFSSLLHASNSQLELSQKTSSSKYCSHAAAESSTTSAKEDSTNASSANLLGTVPINAVQRAVLSVGAAVAAITDPRRHDMVATLGETTGRRALVRIRDSMRSSEEGRLILSQRPRINTSTLDWVALRKAPEGSLGAAYLAFLSDNNVTPDSRREVRFVEDEELRYVMQRYREGHDLFHTVLGMPTNMLGEVAVKWVEAAQTGLPMCGAGALAGPIRFKVKQREKYLKFYLPWAMRVSRTARPLMSVYFEQRWGQDLGALREELGIEPFDQGNR